MKTKLVISATFCILLVLILAGPSLAFQQYSILDLVGQSNLIVIGKVNNVVDDSAGITVTDIIKGQVSEKNLAITQIMHQECTGKFTPIKQGDEAIFLLKSAGNSVVVTGSGEGIQLLRPEWRSDYLQAVRSLISIADMKDEDSKAKAMFDIAASDNPVLRREAQSFIVRIHNKAKYKNNLLVLLNSQNEDARLTALYGLKDINAPEAVPLIIMQVRSGKDSLIEAASTALTRYDTPEVVDAWIYLASSPNPQNRARAVIDMGQSKKPEALETIITALDDPNAEVRKCAAGALVWSFREYKGLKAVPKLISMLNDPDEEVQSRAASSLGESRDASAVEPLFNTLRRANLSERVEGFTVQALYVIYTRWTPDRPNLKAREMIDNNLNLMVEVIKRGHNRSSSEAVGILAICDRPEAYTALQDVAKTDPIEEVRADAKRMLEWREKNKQ